MIEIDRDLNRWNLSKEDFQLTESEKNKDTIDLVNRFLKFALHKYRNFSKGFLIDELGTTPYRLNKALRYDEKNKKYH